MGFFSFFFLPFPLSSSPPAAPALAEDVEGFASIDDDEELCSGGRGILDRDAGIEGGKFTGIVPAAIGINPGGAAGTGNPVPTGGDLIVVGLAEKVVGPADITAPGGGGILIPGLATRICVEVVWGRGILALIDGGR